MNEFKYLDNVRTNALIAETKARLATKVTQYAAMPTASAETSGKIVQYIGTTNSTYTQGDFYIGTYSETADPPASWRKITYNSDEIDSLISAAGHFETVSALPTTDIKTNVIYLVPKTKELTGYSDGVTDNFYYPVGTDDEPAFELYNNDGVYQTTIAGTGASQIQQGIDAGGYTSATKTVQSHDLNNVKDEYINLDGTANGWEKIGDTEIDLSDYVKFENLVPITSEELAAMWED